MLTYHRSRPSTGGDVTFTVHQSDADEAEARLMAAFGVDVQPGQVVVVTYPRQIPAESAQRTLQRLARLFPGHAGLVLEAAGEIQVVSRGKADELQASAQQAAP